MDTIGDTLLELRRTREIVRFTVGELSLSFCPTKEAEAQERAAGKVVVSAEYLASVVGAVETLGGRVERVRAV
jgi:hypothetical protein